MDSFLSESFTSISSPSSDSDKPENVPVRKRKIRATRDFKPFEQKDFEDHKPIVKIKRQNLSFLPKVDDLYIEPSVNNYEPQLDDKNFAKKVATFKIKKLKIITGLTKSVKKRRLSKVKRKSLKKQLESRTENVGRKMSLKLKKAKGVWRSVTDLENFDEKPKVVKELYVKLVSLEKTNLLTEEQRHQLENIRKVAKSPSKNSRKKIRNTSKTRSIRKRIKSKLSIELKSDVKKDEIYAEYYRPCKVILERLPLEQINIINKKSLEISNDINKSQYNKKIRKKLFKSVDEGSFNFSIFTPNGSSSPLGLIENNFQKKLLTRYSLYSKQNKMCPLKNMSGVSHRMDSLTDLNISQNEPEKSKPDENEIDQNLTYTINDINECSSTVQNSTFIVETSDCNDNVVDKAKSVDEVYEISTTSNTSLERSNEQVNDPHYSINEETNYETVLSISDEQTVSSSNSALVDTEEQVQTEKCREEFSEDTETDQPTASIAVESVQIFTPKSLLKTKKSCASAKSNRKVTFSNTSVIIIDDSDVSYGSPVPTMFPPDEDVDSQQEAVGRSPLRIKTHNVSVKSSEKWENKKNIERYPSKSQLTNSNTPKLTKIPDFAKIHKKLFDKMLNIEEYTRHKSRRAQLLLLGQSVSSNCSSSTRSNKHKEDLNKSAKKEVSAKKQIKHPSGQLVKNVSKTANPPQFAISSLKIKQNELNGYTRYGFKATNNKNITKKDQIEAIANKMKPTNLKIDDKRIEIKGVRSNRRFELLMKMRDRK